MAGNSISITDDIQSPIEDMEDGDLLFGLRGKAPKRFLASTVVPGDDTVTMSKLAPGTPSVLIGFNGAGEASEVAFATKSQAEAGSSASIPMGPMQTKQAITAAAISLSIARADIPNRVIPVDRIVVAGFLEVGDLGAGAAYVAGTSAGPMAIQDQAGRWFQLELGDAPSLGWFGWSNAVGADNGPVLQLAHDTFADLSAVTANLLIPPGLGRIASKVTLSDVALKVRGAGETFKGAPGDGSGTWLFHDLLGDPAILITGTAARGTSFSGFGIKQTHPTPGAGWAPTSYAEVFRCQDMAGEFALFDVFAPGCYKLVTSVNSGRPKLHNIRGQFFAWMLWVDECYDAAHVTEIHDWPYWSASVNVLSWQQQNADLIVMGRVDTPFIDGVFGYAKRSVIRPIASSAGAPSHFNIGRICGDATKWPLWVQADGFVARIDQLYGEGGDANNLALALSDSRAIFIEGDSADIQISKLYAFRNTPHCIAMTGDYSHIDIGAAHFNAFDYAQNGSGAILDTGTGNSVWFGSRPLVNPLVAGSAGLNNAGTVSWQSVMQSVGGGANPDILQVASISPGDVNFTPVGGSASINLNLQPKGTGSVRVFSPLQVNGAITFNHAASLVWSVDASAESINLAAGATLSIPAGSGVLQIANNGTGCLSLVLVSGGQVNVVGQVNGTEFVASSTPSSSQIGIYYNGAGQYVIKNGGASTQNLRLSGVKLRPTA